MVVYLMVRFGESLLKNVCTTTTTTFFFLGIPCLFFTPQYDEFQIETDMLQSHLLGRQVQTTNYHDHDDMIMMHPAGTAVQAWASNGSGRVRA